MAGESATLGSESLAFGQASGFEAEPDATAIDQETPGCEAESRIETTGQEMPELKINPEFRDLIPPLSQEEFEALKENLSTYGCRDRLIIWKDQNILLDGHHRHQICTVLGIPFETKEIELPSRAEAKIWIIKNQRGRRNLNESQRAMLAVTLNDIYCEQAKERMGTRTDLGQNLAQCEVGRSAEKAAKDMGVSHQSVTSAKKVVEDGIPELKQMVDATILAVSTAAKVAKLAKEDQKKAQVEIDKKAQEKARNDKITSRVTTSEVDRIIRDISSDSTKESNSGTDENLVNVEQRLNGLIRKLSGFETTTQPEKLAELIKIGENILERMRAIGLKSPSHSAERQLEQIPGEFQLEIDAKTLRFLMNSIVPTDDGIKLKFDSDGLRIISYNKEGSFISSAFMPKSYFSKYELEPCEICLRRARDLTSYLHNGKVQIFIEPEATYYKDRFMRVYSSIGDKYVTQEANVELARSEFVEDVNMPNFSPTCKAVVSIGSKVFVGALRGIKRTVCRGSASFNRIARLSIEDSFLKIVSQEDGYIQRIPLNVVTAGEAHSTFNIARLSDSDTRTAIEKSNAITIGLGKDYPLIMDLTIGKMQITYMLAPLNEDAQPEEYEEYRGVLVDREGNPVDQPTVEYRGVLVDREGNPVEPTVESVEEPVAEPMEESLGTKERRVINPKRTLPEQMPGEGPVESEILN